MRPPPPIIQDQGNSVGVEVYFRNVLLSPVLLMGAKGIDCD